MFHVKQLKQLLYLGYKIFLNPKKYPYILLLFLLLYSSTWNNIMRHTYQYKLTVKKDFFNVLYIIPRGTF